MAMGWLELAATAINPTSSAITADNDLRIVSVTIAAYDYLITLPAEYRLYHSSNRRSSGLVLFVLIRYTSIIVLVVSNVGFFYRGFTPNTCGHFYLAVPALKVVQIMVSQAILAIRAYNISQRKSWVGRILLSAYIMVTIFQWFASLLSRMPVTIGGSCTSASANPQHAISWTFYLAAMLFDCLTLSVSTFYLMQFRAAASTRSALWLVKIILYDGLGYFVALTLMNATNIILFRGANHAIQTSGASLGFSITWIMSQRILIHLHEVRTEPKSVVVAQLVPTSHAMTPMRLGGEAEHRTTVKRNDTQGSPDERRSKEIDLDLQVHVEKSIVVNDGLEDKDSTEQDCQGYDSPKPVWGRIYDV